MFILYANKNQLNVRKDEPLTSGSVNVYTICFQFSHEWDGLTRVAVFKAGTDEKSVLLDDTDQCTIPWEVLQKPMALLQVGVYGTRNGELVLPTIWANLGTVLPGASPGESARPPTPDLWEQELARKQDKLTGAPGQVVGFDESGNAVPQEPRAGEGGTSDHRSLSHREDAAQHPIGAIEGLADELNRIPEPVEALTNLELEELLK